MTSSNCHIHADRAIQKLYYEATFYLKVKFICEGFPFEVPLNLADLRVLFAFLKKGMKKNRVNRIQCKNHFDVCISSGKIRSVNVISPILYTGIQ